jgi:hypothetical protein
MRGPSDARVRQASGDSSESGTCSWEGLRRPEMLLMLAAFGLPTLGLTDSELSESLRCLSCDAGGDEAAADQPPRQRRRRRCSEHGCHDAHANSRDQHNSLQRQGCKATATGKSVEAHAAATIAARTEADNGRQSPWPVASTKQAGGVGHRVRSPYRGVSRAHPTARRWRVQVRHRGVAHNVGTYDEEVEAARAYDATALQLHGPGAVLNFPLRPTSTSSPSPSSSSSSSSAAAAPPPAQTNGAGGDNGGGDNGGGGGNDDDDDEKPIKLRHIKHQARASSSTAKRSHSCVRDLPRGRSRTLSTAEVHAATATATAQRQGHSSRDQPSHRPPPPRRQQSRSQWSPSEPKRAASPSLAVVAAAVTTATPLRRKRKQMASAFSASPPSSAAYPPAAAPAPLLPRQQARSKAVAGGWGLGTAGREQPPLHHSPWPLPRRTRRLLRHQRRHRVGYGSDDVGLGLDFTSSSSSSSDDDGGSDEAGGSAGTSREAAETEAQAGPTVAHAMNRRSHWSALSSSVGSRAAECEKVSVAAVPTTRDHGPTTRDHGPTTNPGGGARPTQETRRQPPPLPPLSTPSRNSRSSQQLGGDDLRGPLRPPAEPPVPCWLRDSNDDVYVHRLHGQLRAALCSESWPSTRTQFELSVLFIGASLCRYHQIVARGSVAAAAAAAAPRKQQAAASEGQIGYQAGGQDVLSVLLGSEDEG